MKSKYVTKEELKKSEKESYSNYRYALLVGIMALGLLATYSMIDNNEDKGLHEFVLLAYNFTEEECAEFGVTHIEPEYVPNCERIRDPDSPECWATGRYECQKYCHTKKKQVGEKCRGDFIICDDERKIGCGAIENQELPYFCEEGFSCRLLSKVCTPIYETTQFGCVDDQTFREARKLVK